MNVKIRKGDTGPDKRKRNEHDVGCAESHSLLWASVPKKDFFAAETIADFVWN